MKSTIANTSASTEQLTVGLAGTGILSGCISDILEDESFYNLRRLIKVIGWAGCGKEQPARLKTVTHYPECSAMFSAHPGLSMACDLSDDGSAMRELREKAPAGTTLVSRQDVERLCRARRHDLPVLAEINRLSLLPDIFSATIDQSDEEVMVIDKLGLIVQINKKALESTSKTKKDFIGQHCSAIMKKGGDAAGKYLKMVMEVKRPMAEDYSETKPDGSIEHYQIKVFPLLDMNNNIQQLILSRKNTTSGVKMERQLKESQHKAVISEMVMGVSHAVRNPVMVIGGFARQLAAMPSLDENARHKAGIILEESARLESMVNQMNEHRLLTDEQLNDISDMNELAENVKELFAQTAAAKSINFTCELSSEVPKVMGRSSLIRQCLLNLVQNSVESISDEGSIFLRTRYVDGQVCLDVEDNGRGIPLEIQEQIFKPFFSTKKSSEAGLGLSLTRKLLSDIGGRLYLYSRPRHFTIFSMMLNPALK